MFSDLIFRLTYQFLQFSNRQLLYNNFFYLYLPTSPLITFHTFSLVQLLVYNAANLFCTLEVHTQHFCLQERMTLPNDFTYEYPLLFQHSIECGHLPRVMTPTDVTSLTMTNSSLSVKDNPIL